MQRHVQCKLTWSHEIRDWYQLSAQTQTSYALKWVTPASWNSYVDPAHMAHKSAQADHWKGSLATPEAPLYAMTDQQS